MTEVTPKILLAGWIDGAVRSFGYVAGSRGIKNFLKGAAEVAVGHIRQAAQEQGINPPSTSDPLVCLQNIAAAETALEILPEGHLSLEPGDNSVVLSMLGCPYAHICTGILGDLIKSNFSREALPCLRTEVYAAAVSAECQRKCKYTLQQFAPGERCTSAIEFLP